MSVIKLTAEESTEPSNWYYGHAGASALLLMKIVITAGALRGVAISLSGRLNGSG